MLFHGRQRNFGQHESGASDFYGPVATESAYFPTEKDRANAAFIEITVQQMDLWIRGITPEPFGLRPMKLERNAVGAWMRTSQEAI
jgi:hypothetical protein